MIANSDLLESKVV